MGRDDQREEREVLDSIFPSEIADVSETEYKVSIALDVANADGDESDAPSMVLLVKYPEDYPDVAPDLELLPVANAAAHPYLDVSVDKAALISGLDETIEENLGMAMIFTVVSTLKDAAESLIASRQADARQVQEERIMAAEKEENKKFHGTPVTPETFSSWRVDFRKELEEKRLAEDIAEEAAEKKRNRGKEKDDRLTGKQLWERGLAGKVDEEEEEGDDLPTSDMQALKV